MEWALRTGRNLDRMRLGGCCKCPPDERMEAALMNRTHSD